MSAPVSPGAGTGPLHPASRKVAWRLMRREPLAYAVAWVCWVAFFLVPIAVGLLLRAVLDRISGDPAGGWSVWALVAVLGGLEVARWLELLFAAVQWHGCWVGWHTIPRLNLLGSLVGDPGPAADRLPGSPGEAVSRFRDDTEDLAMVLDVWLDFSGALVASGVAFAIMFRIEPRATAVVAVPIVAVIWLCRWLAPKLRVWRRQSREATAAVTSFIGDTFGSITAIKAAGAEAAVERRFDALGRRRAAAARRDEVGTQLIQTLSRATANAGIGIAMLLVAPDIRSGSFSVGDLGLFTMYMTVLATLPRWVGRLGAYQRQADVSVERLAELLPTPVAADVVAAVPTSLRQGPGRFPTCPVVDPVRRRDGDRLERLTIEHLGVQYVAGGGISDVDLDLPRGSLTAVTGPVGAGKSTLVRALLGLIPVDEGCIRWNGRPIEPSSFLVPPRAAYLPQVPRLFSEPLADTILLGVEREGLTEALRVACLDEDLADMPFGLDTTVGPKGVRLSGGQVKRAAAARAFVRRPELLVVDDLSSALDVDTERRLWDRFFEATAGNTTVLVVSHRARVLERADRVVVLDRGRMA